MKYIIINGQTIPSEILELSDIQIIDENGKIQKGFYSEASTNVFKDFIDYEKCK